MNLWGLFFCVIGAALLTFWAWLEYPKAINVLDPPGSYELVQRISGGRSFVLMTTGFTFLSVGFLLIFISRSPLIGWLLFFAAVYFAVRYFCGSSSRRQWEIRRSLALWVGNWRKIFRPDGLGCCYCGRPAQVGRLVVKVDTERRLADLYVGHPACLERWEDAIRDSARGWEVAVMEELTRIQFDGVGHLEQLLKRAKVEASHLPGDLAAERLQMLQMALEGKSK